jgi:hypothetical protein
MQETQAVPQSYQGAPLSRSISRRVTGQNIWLSCTDSNGDPLNRPANRITPEILESEEAVGRAQLEELKEIARSTSWPPHEHARMLEEAYLSIDMPAPAFGVQFVYTNPEKPELIQVVHEGDVVLMPQGYHPNVSAPGTQINFLWMMAAIREGEDRQYGVVNVQPEFAAGGSGLEAVAGK